MADENKLILLNAWASPFGARVRIALAEKGIDYEFREENLRDKSPLLLKMNPVNKQIPVLIHGGKPVCESLVIVEYIDKVWNHKSPLLPSDPYQRARARFWADYVDKKAKITRQIIYAYRKIIYETNHKIVIYSIGRQVWSSIGETQEVAKKELIGCFKLLEGELGDNPYFVGHTFGILDVALIPFYSWFYTLEQFGINMVEECPKLVAWARKCLQKESVSKSLPDQYKIYDLFMEMKKKIAA
ncbi:glutathione transferase [Sarracenia purpurea var. burkii]